MSFWRGYVLYGGGTYYLDNSYRVGQYYIDNNDRGYILYRGGVTF